MKNPIQNKAQAYTAERYIDYLKLKLNHSATSASEQAATQHELSTLISQLDDYRTNIAIRLVVDNTVASCTTTKC